MAESTCPQCHRPVDDTWQLCPICGQRLAEGAPGGPGQAPDTRATTDGPAVVRLACPSCGGELPLPTETTEYLPCPYCASSLHLRRRGGGFSLELVERVGRSIGHAVGEQVGQEMDAKFRVQQAQLHRIHAEQAQTQGQIRPAVMNWIAAYELVPEFAPARDWLGQFVSMHEPKLTSPLAANLGGLAPGDRAALQLLNADPAKQPPGLPQAPRPPRAPGKVSMGLLRKVAASRATVMEEMYAERVSQHKAAHAQYAAEHQTIAQDYEARKQDWESRRTEVRGNLAQMATLCLAAVEEEERRRQEEERRRQEAERQRQIAAAQQQQQQMAQMQRQLQEMNRRGRKR